MEGVPCRLLVPFTLLMTLLVAATISADDDVGYATVVGNKHKLAAERENAPDLAAADDGDVGYADVMGNKHKKPAKPQKGA